MVGVLHIGNTPANFAGGWADAGWDEPDGAGMSGLLRFANSQRTEGAQTFLAALLFGGTFTRNPGVTIVLAFAVTFMNLVVDILYAYLDPRVRYS